MASFAGCSQVLGPSVCFTKQQSPRHPGKHSTFSHKQVTRCSAAAPEEPISLNRRAALVGLSAGLLSLSAQRANADLPEFTTLYGLDSPPTSYGGYGGNAQEDAKYTFVYPSSWKRDVIGKVEKGTQGIDAKVTNPRNKGQKAFVITFGRAGEDNKRFKLGDVDQTLAGFAGADYQLQDALVEATNKKVSERDVDGQVFYDYEIESPDVHYLSSITLQAGKVFAMFVKTTPKSWKEDEDLLRTIVSSFRTINKA